MCFGKRKKVLVSVFEQIQKEFPLAIQISDIPHRGRIDISKKMHNYWQYLQFPSCAMKSSNTDSEPRIRFFRNFRNFLVPGLYVRKSRISRDMKENAKNVEKLPIFQKSIIFHCPLKCVDGGCHRRYKIFGVAYHFHIHSIKIMLKFHEIRLILKNT